MSLPATEPVAVTLISVAGMALTQGALDDDFLHVAGALINLAHAHVAVDALQREIAHVAVAAQGLNGGAAHLLGHLAGEQLGHRRFFQARATRIAQRSRVPDQLPRRFQISSALRKPEAHRLVVEDGRAKALAEGSCHGGQVAGWRAPGSNPIICSPSHIPGLVPGATHRLRV